ncbi:ATP-dependent Clp protease ATP-binding subunit [Neobacillus cucumis]|uniref:ATP-dependent Clp protease ATP-binding subunit n=1 Tax=Neobacillus cucumis TaxID=1740721 RepID=UPI002041F994|nr:ATP-dependent Clp protease ATP-binding subunit [Neobacillus cucumis]MCM3729184.1 ATP-dependent Clp protease ATP-binding subunit [Neobacillus cucumis]
MICQNCQTSPASYQLNFSFNHGQSQISLCAECYDIAKQKLENGSIQLDNQMFNLLDTDGSQPEQNKNVHVTKPKKRKKNSFLDQHGRNLTNEAKEGRIDGVIGRDQEIERILQILNRRTKNNPVLIGEAGVGKTAIVEGLALQIVKGKVPAKLKTKEVYLLDISSLVAGTSYRGQFEEKMKKLIAELQQRKNVILFIDELHMMVGAGGTSDGSMDAGNILKPALARGEIQIVGATTMKEYRMIEKDPALERRFQSVIVKEPSVNEAFEILKGIRPAYEKYHDVTYSDDVLKACVTLSKRYIQDRFLPDKAIDLMDEAGAILNLAHGELDVNYLKQRLKDITEEKQQATKLEHYEKAAILRDEEREMKQKLSEYSDNIVKDITVEMVQEIIEKSTGIPVQKLQKAEQQKMKDLKEKLASKIIGQDKAIEKVANAILRASVGLKPKTRPTASFLFLGPTGTGKTELTKTLAAELFGSKDAMIRLDMSEYMEKHSVSKLIGSPPGYVGHEDAGQFTEQVRRNPYSIILLDEIEKAHPDVMNVFLQIMEDGRLTDSQGRVVSFTETIIIMTSNAGVGNKTLGPIGFGSDEQQGVESHIVDKIGNHFKLEFLNRIDSIIEFNHLQKENLVEIIEIMMAELKETLEEQGISIEIDKEAKEKIAELGYSNVFGARPLRRVIQEKIEDKITSLIINSENVTTITVSVENNNINVA